MPPRPTGTGEGACELDELDGVAAETGTASATRSNKAALFGAAEGADAGPTRCERAARIISCRAAAPIMAGAGDGDGEGEGDGDGGALETRLAELGADGAGRLAMPRAAGRVSSPVDGAATGIAADAPALRPITAVPVGTVGVVGAVEVAGAGEAAGEGSPWDPAT